MGSREQWGFFTPGCDINLRAGQAGSGEKALCNQITEPLLDNRLSFRFPSLLYLKILGPKACNVSALWAAYPRFWVF